MKLYSFLQSSDSFHCGISDDGRYWRSDHAGYPANELRQRIAASDYNKVRDIDVRVHKIPCIYEEQCYKCITPWKVLTKRLTTLLYPSLILQTSSFLNDPHCFPNFRHRIDIVDYGVRINFLYKTIDPRNPYAVSTFCCRGGPFLIDLCKAESIQFFNNIGKGIYCKLIQTNMTLIIPNQ